VARSGFLTYLELLHHASKREHSHFEGEVDPFQLTVLRTEPLGFFRRAWRHNLRYIQGCVVDEDELLQQLISPMSGTSLGQLALLTVSYQGQQIFPAALSSKYWPPKCTPRCICTIAIRAPSFSSLYRLYTRRLTAEEHSLHLSHSPSTP
jgi:hypothetical protein